MGVLARRVVCLGALAINSISGINITLCMYLLAVFAIFITLGGMKVIGYTDVIQVFFLILGGLVTTYLALNLVSEKFGTTGTVTWFNKRYGHDQDNADWIKLHFMTGVTTNVITGVEISGRYDHDGPFLPALVESTARNFTMREVSADTRC